MTHKPCLNVDKDFNWVEENIKQLYTKYLQESLSVAYSLPFKIELMKDLVRIPLQIL